MTFIGKNSYRNGENCMLCSCYTRTNIIFQDAIYLITSALDFSFVESLLPMIVYSAVQSSAQTFIHNAILFIDTSNNV